MRSKLYLILIIGLSIFAIVATDTGLTLENRVFENPQTQTIPLRLVGSQIASSGSIHSENEATLHFQTPGQLAYLPVKEGDVVLKGQTIAQLDTYALQRNLQLAANTYQTTKNTTDQTLENQQAGVVEGQQRLSLDTYNKNGYSAIPETTVIFDTVKRLVDTSNLSQNSAQLNVDLANYAIQLATLTAPFSGVITHEDVSSIGVNVTATTNFIIADPKHTVFRADVSAEDIDFVHVGDKAMITITGTSTKPFSARVTKMYQQRSISSGVDVYRVDITADQPQSIGKLDQTGVALISSDVTQQTFLVPSWTIINHTYLWVMDNNKPVLKHVVVGKTHGNNIEVLQGVVASDRVITNPASLANKYKLL